MALFLSIFNAVLLPIILVAAAGYLVGRFGHLDPRPLSQVTFFLFNPALAFTALAGSKMSLDVVGRLVLLTVLVELLLFALARLFTRRMDLSMTTGSALVLATVFANSGNYGMSVTEYAFGVDAVAMAVICYLTGNLAVNSWGVYVAARGRAGVKHSLGQVLLNPALYTLLLGILANRLSWTPPLPIGRALDLMARATVPTMIVVLGMQLAARPRERRHWRLVGLASAMRLLVSPLFALALVFPLGLTGLAGQIGVLENAVPSAVMGTIVASRYDTEPSLVAGAVLVSTVISLLTVTALLALMFSAQAAAGP